MHAADVGGDGAGHREQVLATARAAAVVQVDEAVEGGPGLLEPTGPLEIALEPLELFVGQRAAVAGQGVVDRQGDERSGVLAAAGKEVVGNRFGGGERLQGVEPLAVGFRQAGAAAAASFSTARSMAPSIAPRWKSSGTRS